MGQAGSAESTVAPRRGPPKSLGLEHHDLALGVLLQRKERSPQPGEPSADDRQIDLMVNLQRSPRLRPAAVVPPQRGG